MKFYRLYFRRRAPLLIMLALFIAIFAAVFALYGISPVAVFYPAILCVVAGAPVFIRDIVSEHKKYSRLSAISKLSGELMSAFPEEKSPSDEAYMQIIEALRLELRRLGENASAKYRDTVEYYTLWVHQIKTPIASMRLALQNEDTPASRRLEADLRRIEQYVDMVLAYLRLDSPTSDYVFRETSLDAVIRKSIKKFAAEFIDRHLTLDYKGTDKTAVTDEKWLRFALEQIISNALKYTREGGITISVEEPLTIVIRDTGIGIVPEDLPRIFEKGYTGLNGRRDKHASGIGLYLCRRILKNLGAAIDVESAPDRGTAVFVRMSRSEIRVE